MCWYNVSIVLGKIDPLCGVGGPSESRPDVIAVCDMNPWWLDGGDQPTPRETRENDETRISSKRIDESTGNQTQPPGLIQEPRCKSKSIVW